MISDSSCSSSGYAWNIENSCTPAGRPERKASKRMKVASGSGCLPMASSSAGVSSVSSSLARVERVARMRPWCQARIDLSTTAGSVKPNRARVFRVSGSLSAPVKAGCRHDRFRRQRQRILNRWP